LPVPVAASYAMMFIQLHQLKPESVWVSALFACKKLDNIGKPMEFAAKKLVEDG